MSLINHCGLSAEIEAAELTAEDLQEEVLERSGQIITEAQTGKKSKPHKLYGVELISQMVAVRVLTSGAEKLCGDFGVDFDELAEHAASQHISSC